MESPDQHLTRLPNTTENSDNPWISLEALRRCHEDVLLDAQKIANRELLDQETIFAVSIQDWHFWTLIDPQKNLSEHERQRAWRNSGIVALLWSVYDMDSADENILWTPTTTRVPFDTTPEELTDLVRGEVHESVLTNTSFQQYLKTRKKHFRAQAFLTIWGHRSAYMNRDVFGRTRVARLADMYHNDVQVRKLKVFHTVIVEITMASSLEDLRWWNHDSLLDEKTQDHQETTRQAQAYAAIGLCRAPGSHTQTPPILDFQLYVPPPRPECASKLKTNTRAPVVLDILISNHSEIAELDVPARVKMELSSATGDCRLAILAELHSAYDGHCERRYRKKFAQHVQSLQAHSRLYEKSRLETMLFVIPQKPSLCTANKKQPVGVRRAHYFDPSLSLEMFLDGVSERTLDLEAHLVVDTTPVADDGWSSHSH